MWHTAKSLRPWAWYQRSGSKQYSTQTKKHHERALADVQHKLNRVPFRRTADPAKFGRYVDALTEPMTWDALQRYAKRRVLCKDRFQAKKHLQRALDHEVDVLCKPREGTDQTLLLYGNGASSNPFRKVKNTAKGPAKKVFDQAVRRKKAVCIWADEFRTSKLGIDGHLLVHPEERRVDRLDPPPCKAARHGLGEAFPGCRCFCNESLCHSERKVLSTLNAMSNTTCAARSLVLSTSVARGTETWRGR